MMAISGLFAAEELAAIQDMLADPALYEDGRLTAGWHAREVKHNLQARKGGLADGVLRKIEAVLLQHELFVAAARPKCLAKLLISRYGPGMTYGSHVDDALMGGVRTDLSFTLFLADPASYEGGELVIEDGYQERRVKLEAGQLILYPSTSLHRVEPVTEGMRLAAVGWVRSHIRQQDQREILFDLETSLRQVHEAEGKSPLFDRLVKTRTNLLRLWAED
ncbi:MAG: Fe2+-dependent dioxygenase [Alphaproteobacteria bacterium]